MLFSGRASWGFSPLLHALYWTPFKIWMVHTGACQRRNHIVVAPYSGKFIIMTFKWWTKICTLFSLKSDIYESVYLTVDLQVSRYIVLTPRCLSLQPGTQTATLKWLVSAGNYIETHHVSCLLSVAVWKHKFGSECLGPIIDKAFGAHPLSYDLLKRLDQRMRNYYVPPSLRLPGFGGVVWNQDVQQPPGFEPSLIMTRHFVITLKEISTCLTFIV